LRTKSLTFELDKVILLNKGTQQLTFADYNADGNIDILFGICEPYPYCTINSTIYIIFNQQIQFCSGLLGGKNCRPSSKICDGDPNYKFGNGTATQSEDNALILNLDYPFWVQENQPLTIRVGDYNLDGYPDLLIPTNNTIQLWKNIPNPVQPVNDPLYPTRSFVLQTDGATSLMEITNPLTATFFDLDETGILDIIVVSSNISNANYSDYFPTAFMNSYFIDAFFLKTMGLNGVCPAFCDTNPKFPNPKPYGVNFPGAVMKFTVTTLDGKLYPAIGSQLSQSAYNALLTPYCSYGLGRTSNYVENLFLGVPLNDPKGYTQMWTPIIPNSQVVAFPYPRTTPLQWTLELTVAPSRITLWILVALLSALVLNLIVIGIFQLREKRLDDKDEKSQAQKIASFNAL